MNKFDYICTVVNTIYSEYVLRLESIYLFVLALGLIEVNFVSVGRALGSPLFVGEHSEIVAQKGAKKPESAELN